MPESLQAKLMAARQRWRSLLWAGGLATSFAVMTALALLSFYSDRWLVLSTTGRLGWLLALLIGAAACVLLFLVLPLRRPIPDEAVAAEVERRYPTLGERLLTTIELAHAGAGAGVSGAMIAQLARETERLAAPLDFVRAVPTAPLRRRVPYASVAAVLLLGHLALAPDAMRAWFHRILSPTADIPIYARTLVWVTPDDTVVPRGEDVEIGVKVGGRLTEQATLHYRFEGGPWTKAELEPVPTPNTPIPRSGKTAHPNVHDASAARNPSPGNEVRFAFKLPEIQQSVTFYATAGDGRANPRTIRVEDRPTILNVRLRLDYPAYTGRRPEAVEATAGNIVAPVGTRVEVTATANKPLQEATLVEDGKARGPWTVDGETVRGGLTVTRDLNYGLRLRDRNGFDALTPPQYTIRAQPDRAPVVQVVKPGADVERTPDGALNLRITASDDYGVREMRLVYRLGKRSASLPLPNAERSSPNTAQSAVRWNLAPLRLRPGDTLVYEAQARDGDTVSGPHTGRSASYRVHILSAREMAERMEAQAAQEEEALRQLIQRQKEAQSLLEKARRTPNRVEALNQAQAAQRNVAQEAADLARRIQQTTEQMRDNNLGTPSAMQRREAAQQSLQQLAQKSMPAAADTIQRAMETRPAAPLLADAARQEQAIREALERLAQQMSRTPTASELAQEAERLAHAQQRLAEQADLAAAQMNYRSPQQMTAQERARLNALARQQADLRAQTQALQQQLQQSAREAQERGQEGASDLQKAAQQMRQAGVPQKQSSAQRHLQSGQPSEASPQQNQAARDLQNLANRLDQIGQKQNAESLENRAERLEQAAQRLEQMAREQAQIARQTQWNPDDEMTRRLAERERNLRERAQQVAPELRDAPAAQQGISRAAQNLQQSENQLNRSSPQSATMPAQQATRELFRAAMEAREAARNLQEQQQAREMQRAVEQMAREQRALQRQTRQFDHQRQNSGLTPEQQKRAEGLAREQQRLLERGQNIAPEMPSMAFRWAMNEANRRMESASRGLQQQNSGEDTQRYQENAAQTLERIARSLGQQAQGEQQQSQSGQNGQPLSGAEQQMADASGELQLAREMEAQIRQETGSLDRRRSRNPNRNLTAEQQRELNFLAQAQRETQRITEQAAQRLRGQPEIGQTVQRAAEEMEEVQDSLRQQQTDAPTQQRQERIVNMLDRALRQTQQAMRQQRQQMAQQGQQMQQSQQQAQAQPGNQPLQRTNAPVVQAQPGVFGKADPRGRGFGALPPRAQQSLREGRQERVPAEYRDLVNQYYKALSERGK